MSTIGHGRFLRARSSRTAFANVHLAFSEAPVDAVRVLVDCHGDGWTAQGNIEEVSACGYDDWKRGAIAGVEFAFRQLGERPCLVTVTKIEGVSSDTNPAAVGAAAALRSMMRWPIQYHRISRTAWTPSSL
jgi:hypothetical protein